MLTFIRQRLWAQFLIPMSFLVIIASGSLIAFSISTMVEMSNFQLASQNKKLAESIQSGMFDLLSVGNNDAVKRQFEKLSEELSGLNVYVYDRDGKIFFSTDIESEQKSVKPYIGEKSFLDVTSMIETGRDSGNMLETLIEQEPYAVVNMVIPNEQKCFHCHGSSNTVIGGISVCSTKQHIGEAIKQGVKKNILVGISGLLFLIGFVVIFFHFMINKKVRVLLRATEKMRKRDLTHVNIITGRNEIDHTLARINLVNKDLSDSIKQIIDVGSNINDSSHGLNRISRNFLEGCKQTSKNSSSVAFSSGEMSSSLNSIAATMEQSTDSLSTVASASKEMSSTVNEIAQNTNLTKTIIEKAAKEFVHTGKIIQDLGVAAKEVDEQTDEIRTISEHVSLLALNARIESARAGEAGKGFAVVAEEIAVLAVATNEFTDKIDNKLKWMQDKAEETVKGMKGLAENLDESDQAVSGIASSVEEQNVTTSEIATKLGEVSQGISEANKNVLQGATAASEVAKRISEVEKASRNMEDGSAEIEKEAGSLSHMAEKLKILLDTFKV